MSDDGDLHYLNLGSCRVTLHGVAASSSAPVKLPASCLEAANVPPREKVYDFALGMVLKVV